MSNLTTINQANHPFMRFRLILRNLSKVCNLPINYPPYISANIYRFIQQADAAYAKFLHNQGYVNQSATKRFKYFTFGQLRIPRHLRKIKEGRLLVKANYLSLEVSFLIEKASESFVMGLFQNQRLHIIDEFAHNEFLIERVEMLPYEIIKPTLQLRTLTPLVIARKNSDGKHSTYLAPTEAGYEQIFRNNLLSKYEAYQQLVNPNEISQLPETAISFKLLPSTTLRSKLITVKPKLPKPIKVKGYMFDFEITAPLEVLKVGFFGGWGSNSALGFGLTKFLRKEVMSDEG